VGPTMRRWGHETAARELVREMVRALPVTMATVTLWDQADPSFKVAAVSTQRPLSTPPPVGSRVPLAQAPWHRMAFERCAPVHLEQDEPSGGMSPTELDLTLVRDARSVYLLPIVFSEEVVGVLALGEVRSREREPFTEEKRRRCLSRLNDLLVSSASAWDIGRLRRQVRVMSQMLQTFKRVLEAKSYDDLLATLASQVASWLSTPIRGMLVRTDLQGRPLVVGRWPMSEPMTDEAAVPLLLSVTRSPDGRRGLVAVTRVADDPLDPLRLTAPGAETWTRICLPLLDDARLQGMVFLYVEEEFNPSSWELEGLRWLAEVAQAWMTTVAVLRHHDRAWLRLVASSC